MNRALFVDRDGVINIEKNYVYRIRDFEFIKDVFKFFIEIQKLGYLIIIITNQSGIGRGYYSDNDFKKLTAWMLSEFKKNGINITDVYYDPYHPEFGKGKYKRKSYKRKPNPGMILEAAQKYNIDLKNSILVGDNDSDILAGVNAGINKLFLLKSGVVSLKDDIISACTQIKNLREITCFLKNEFKKKES